MYVSILAVITFVRRSLVFHHYGIDIFIIFPFVCSSLYSLWFLIPLPYSRWENAKANATTYKILQTSDWSFSVGVFESCGCIVALRYPQSPLFIAIGARILQSDGIAIWATYI